MEPGSNKNIRVLMDDDGVAHWVTESGYCPDHDHTVDVQGMTPHPEAEAIPASTPDTT